MKMMNKFCALMLSVALCAGMAAPAFAYGGEPVEEAEQPVLTSTTDEEDVVTVTDEETGALTPEGNLTLVDDYHTDYSDGSGQQFITLVSKSGNTFYLVIDRNAKGQQTVHFMNLVDEADLLALMEEEDADAYTAEKEAAAQAEQDRLKSEEEAKKAAEEAAASGTEQPTENKVTKIASGFLGVVVLIALAAGGIFYAFTKQKQKKQAEKEAQKATIDNLIAQTSNEKTKKTGVSSIGLVTAGVAGAMTNTLLVMNLIFLFFREAYASANNVAVSGVYTFILSIIGINGVPEAIVAGVLTLCIGRALLKKNVRERLGFRNDINELINICNIGVLLSYREGLPRNLMELMACGKKVIATNIRGCRDIVVDETVGELVEVGDYEATAKAIEEEYLYGNNEFIVSKEIEKYDVKTINEGLRLIYKELEEGGYYHKEGYAYSANE